MPCRPLSCQCGKYNAPLRHVVTVMSLFGIVLSYAQRVSLNIAIVEIVGAQNASNSSACPTNKRTVLDHVKDSKTYKWNEDQQSFILLSFYIGYLPGHVMGPLCDRYGAKWFLTFVLVSSSICTALMPTVIWHLPWYFLAILRIIQGFGQGGMYPGVTALLSRWVPSSERATLCGVVYSGNSVGQILGTFLTGIVINYTKSWAIAFYFWSTLGVLWIFFFVIYVTSTPTKHKHILPDERELISADVPHREHANIPYGPMLTDLAVWGVIIAQIGHDWLLFTLSSNLPKYMNNVLNYNIKENAVASSVPYIAQYASSMAFGKLADYLISTKHYNLEAVRKIYCVLGALLPGAFMVAIGYAECNGPLAIGFVAMGLFCKGPSYSSVKVTPIDICKHHAGMITTLSNGMGSLTGIATPYIVAQMAPQNTLPQWKLVYWIVFCIQVGTSLVYILFASAKRAFWDYTEEERNDMTAEELAAKRWYSKSPAQIMEKKRIKDEKAAKAKEAKDAKAKAKQDRKDAKDVAKTK